jgi:septum formation protein
MELILASSSPRRASILEGAGYRFTVAHPDTDERPLPREDAASLVLRLARLKAAAITAAGAVVLAADTMVVFGDRILGKPRDSADAVATLLSLGGRSHEVVTGWALDGPQGPAAGVERTEVEMLEIGREEAEAYVATGEPLDKAGSYAIQARGDRFVSGLVGLRSNVMGLPIEVIAPVLSSMGIRPER